MGLGTGIFLLVAGAVLAFAVRDGVSAVDLTAVGWICMGAGALSLVLVLATGRRRGRVTSTTYVERHDGVPPGA
ncbi:DUF6458 family protein [Quadrisphaera oryzae]|uniref:DUF6458 family protein n=1 Tax=Quadrisphaera TaxID=317661 RepID=UPI0016453537|nr:DUF6458 family protein [Quadrisphaera sp. RL12-1S]MBC3760741.1 hypothetical protein [Quadrisphaera sp. RL12-1S]